MRERKYEINRYALYDFSGIEHHLNTMAAKGWMIEEMNQLRWRYRRVEPQELEFAVNYDLDMNPYAPSPSEKQMRLREISEFGGWEFVTEWTLMQVFYRPKTNEGVPFQTEPEVILKIHRDLGIRDLSFLVIIFIMWTLFAMIHSEYQGEGFSPTILLMFWGMVLFTTWFMMSEFWFWLWYRRSRVSVEHGRGCVPAGKGYQISRACLLAITILGLGHWICNYASLGHLVVGGLYLTMSIFMVALQEIVRNRNRKQGVAEKKNWLAVWAVGFILYFLTSRYVTWWVLPYAIEHGWF